MAQFVEAIPHFLLRIFAPALGVCLVAWLIVLFVQLFSGKRHSCRFPSAESGRDALPRVRSGESAASPRGGLGKPVWAGLAALAIVCTTLCGKNTNGVQGVGGPLLQFNPPIVLTVTPQNITNGWRVAEESGAEAFAPPPTGAVTNERWRLRGAYDDAFRIPADGWSYPYASGMTVLSRGELRTNIRTRDFPRPFVQDLSLVPFVNWPLLPEGRQESFFWHAPTPSNTLLTTWWNAALGRDATNPVNFQAELFPNGGFTYRYEDRTVRHARVWPFDWDDDGLENTVDPDPLTPGPDAHGTNAEWYNTVCSNVLEAVATSYDPPGGGTRSCASAELSWREGVNSNAYYFVDVVTERGPAPIYFTGDRDSRLGNPVVVARAFETNHVPLLIGVDYSVTSDTPFTVSYPMEYMYPELETNELCRAHIRWPLNFVFTESIGTSNRVYTVTVEPYDPGGVFEWGDSGGGVPMRGGSSGGSCNCVSYGVNSVWFTCSSGTCESGCVAHGSYLLERSSFSVEGGECRCGFDDPPPDDYKEDLHEPGDQPSLAITFSEQAVIFEDAFQERPGMTRPKRSARVRLTIDAYGGPGGGTLSLSGVNMDKLVVVDGNVTLPYNDVLAPGGSYHASGVYEGANGSGGENDVVVSGTLTLSAPYNPLSDEASLTSVKVALEAEFTARDNPCQSRHTYGVGERVKFNVTPALSAIKLRALKADTTDDATPYDTFGSDSYFHGVSDADASQMRTYICPATGTRPDISVTLAGTEYKPVMTTVEPSEVVSPTASGSWDVGFGHVGFGCLRVANYIGPFHVSFEGVKVGEIPCYDAIPPTGFFASPNYTGRLTHDADACSGRQYKIKAGNYWRHDDAGSDLAIDNWSAGTLVWKIPIGWTRLQNEEDTNITRIVNCDYERYRDANSRPLLIGGRTDAYTQTFSIDASGTTTLEKFGWRMTRSRWSFSGTVEEIE